MTLATTQMNNSEIYSLTREQGILLVAPIARLEQLEQEASAEDMRAVASFTSPTRRAERLAWRIMLRRWAGRDIEVEYAPNGAPQIKNFTYTHISVSHCQDKVAVALSVQPCAVDIERIDRNFSRLAPRFMGDKELAMAATDIEQAAVWSGKETLYKLYGKEGIDLRQDINITSLDLAHNTLRGKIVGHDEVEMRIQKIDEHHIVVYHI